MNKLKLFEAGIDTKSGLERFDSNQELYEKWLKNFLNDENYANAKKMIQQKKYKEAFNFAHTLKGITGNLSMILLYDEVCVLVESLREESYNDLDEIIKNIDVEYNIVIEAIKAYI